LIKELNDEILDNYEDLKVKGLNDQTTTLYSSLIDFVKALPEEPETEPEKQVAISTPEEPEPVTETKGLGERLAEQVKENNKVISQQSEYFGK
jgi:hypothetical protein